MANPSLIWVSRRVWKSCHWYSTYSMNSDRFTWYVLAFYSKTELLTVSTSTNVLEGAVVPFALSGPGPLPSTEKFESKMTTFAF